MSRASEIEKALHAYQLANRIHNDSEAALHDAANAALAYAHGFVAGAEAMREACCKRFPALRKQIEEMPLPGAKEGT